MLGDAVRRFDARAAGVNVDEVPGGESAFIIEPGLDLDYCGRPEVSPGKLLLAGPAQGDRSACGFRQAGCFHTGFSSVLSTEPGAEIRNDDTHLVVCQVERAGQFRPAAEGVLGAGPNGQ